MNERANTLAGVNMASLRSAADAAAAAGNTDLANDCNAAMQKRAVTQTMEIENCGRLFEHVEPASLANGGRWFARYTGDMDSWLQAFKRAGATCGLNRDTGIVARETLKLREGERAAILRPGQRIVSD